ncbi:MAG: SDR family NAD(P)-dependent oxidoreductase [Armatimonas sp.]
MTGARIGIGEAVALRLLRSGARVIALTRFPTDAVRRYETQPDASCWRERLTVHGLDFRHVVGVEEYAVHLATTLPRLDLLVNNAAQTLRLPPTAYAALEAGEKAPLMLPPLGLPVPVQSTAAHSDSWRLRDHEVSALELVEAQLINAVAPFLLTSRLKPLLQKSAPSFVVNVTSQEGRFEKKRKSEFHPHTNMAKAALNIFTRTIADEYRRSGIWVNAVDPGWVSLQHTSQAPAGIAAPFDFEDAAARVLDPLLLFLTEGTLCSGQLLKDFQAVAW